MVAVIFHMNTYLCINILVYKQKCKKCQNGLLWAIKHMDVANGARNFNLMNINNQPNDF